MKLHLNTNYHTVTYRNPCKIILGKKYHELLSYSRACVFILYIRLHNCVAISNSIRANSWSSPLVKIILSLMSKIHTCIMHTCRQYFNALFKLLATTYNPTIVLISTQNVAIQWKQLNMCSKVYTCICSKFKAHQSKDKKNNRRNLVHIIGPAMASLRLQVKISPDNNRILFYLEVATVVINSETLKKYFYNQWSMNMESKSKHKFVSGVENARHSIWWIS